MGVWGTSLYSNDTASDVRDDYIELLRRGQDSAEITNQLMETYRSLMGTEEEPLFWYVLADVQWNYGRLLPEVQEKAIDFLDDTDNPELDRWKEAGEKQLQAWQKTLSALRDKLLSPQPPKKNVRPRKLYRCPWNRGDVYAYRFSEEFSQETGFYGKHLVSRKITERESWPGHIVPAVHIYNYVWDELPTMEEACQKPLLPTNYYPTAFIRYPHLERTYLFKLDVTKAKDVPVDRLTYLGNYSDNIPDEHSFTPIEPIDSCPGQIWRFFEKWAIDMYLHWRET